MPLRAVLLIALLLPLGCAVPTDAARDAVPAVEFRALHGAYAVGDTAVVVLRNASDEPVGYNFCLSARERRVGGGWRRFGYLRVCTTELRTLEPGAEAVLREPITAEWEPGEHRLVTTVEGLRSGARGEIFTSPFAVAPAPR